VAPVSSAIRMPRKEKGDPSEIVGMAGVLSQELDLGNGQDMIGLGGGGGDHRGRTLAGALVGARELVRLVSKIVVSMRKRTDSEGES